MKNKRLWIYISVFVLLCLGLLVYLFCKPQGALESAITLPPPQAEAMNVYILDVGQGDAILILSPENEAILVDCGSAGSEQTVLSAMELLGINKLSKLVLTHGHEDHIGGAQGLIQKKKAESLYLCGQYSQYPASLFTAIENSKLPYENLWADDTLSVGDGVLTLLSPHQEHYLAQTNANSALIRLSYLDSSLLLCADVTEKTEQLLLSLYPLEQLQAQGIKIAHHGGDGSSSTLFLQATAPELALISVGENSYGHPDEDVLNRLTQLDIPYHTTQEQGTLHLVLNGHDCRFCP